MELRSQRPDVLIRKSTTDEVERGRDRLVIVLISEDEDVVVLGQARGGGVTVLHGVQAEVSHHLHDVGRNLESEVETLSSERRDVQQAAERNARSPLRGARRL